MPRGSHLNVLGVETAVLVRPVTFGSMTRKLISSRLNSAQSRGFFDRKLRRSPWSAVLCCAAMPRTSLGMRYSTDRRTSCKSGLTSTIVKREHARVKRPLPWSAPRAGLQKN